MKPALAAEEWTLYRDWQPSDVRQLDADAVLHEDGAHALAALALYGQHFGFTRDDVAALRDLIATRAFGDTADVDHFASLADRIEALLPPP